MFPGLALFSKRTNFIQLATQFHFTQILKENLIGSLQYHCELFGHVVVHIADGIFTTTVIHVAMNTIGFCNVGI